MKFAIPYMSKFDYFDYKYNDKLLHYVYCVPSFLSNLDDDYKFKTLFDVLNPYSTLPYWDLSTLPIVTTLELDTIFNDKISPLLDLVENSGLIVSDPRLVTIVKVYNPNVRIIMKGNINFRAMYQLYKGYGISELILSPDSLRNTILMEDISNILKAPDNNVYQINFYGILNNMLHYGSSNLSTIDFTESIDNYSLETSNYSTEDCMRRNFILPRWLKRLPKMDTYVLEPTRNLFELLKAYVSESDDSDTTELFSLPQRIPIVDVPNKLIKCRCRECDVKCTTCKDTLTRLNIL